MRCNDCVPLALPPLILFVLRLPAYRRRFCNEGPGMQGGLCRAMTVLDVVVRHIVSLAPTRLSEVLLQRGCRNAGRSVPCNDVLNVLVLP